MVRKSKIVAAVATVVLGAAALVAAPVGAAPAQALTPGVAFSADSLPTWQTNGVVWSLAAAGDKVFAGGTFSQLRPPSGGSGSAIPVTGLVALDTTTGQPTSCRPQLSVGSGITVRALATSPDGATLYVGGLFGRVDSTYANKIAAVDVATCTVRSTFTAPSVSATVRALAATPDVLYVGGDFRTVGGERRDYFAALDARTGALLPWRADADAVGRAIAVSPDGGTVMLGGDFFTVGGANSHSLAAVDAGTGAVTRTYPRGFIPDTSVTKAVDAGQAGFYVGNEGTGGGVFDGRLALAYGSLDQVWRDTCLGATQAVLEHDGLLYAGHHAHDCESMGWFTEGKRTHLTAQRVDDAQLAGWYPDTNDGIGESIGPRALTVATAGSQQYLWVGGEFTTTNGSAQQGLTRFGQVDTGAPPVPTVTVESTTTGAVHVRWRSVVDPDDSELAYEVFRNGGATPIATVRVASSFWTRPQGSFVDTSVTPGQTYSYRVRATDGTNVSALSGAASVAARSSDVAYPAAVLADQPSLYWRYEEGSGGVAWDSAGQGRNGVLTGTPAFRSTTSPVGDGGWAMGFGDGRTAHSDWIEQGPSTYSVETWFRTTSTQGGKIVGFGNGQSNRMSPAALRTSGSYDRHVYMTDAGKLVFGVYTGSTQTVTSPRSYNDGEWHHVVATQGAAGMTMYVDGVPVGRNGTTTAQSYKGSWRVGGDNLDGWPSQPSSRYFGGDVDETAVYPTALTAAQVQAHYTASGRTLPGQTPPPDAYGQAVHALGPDLFWRLGETGGTTAADSGPYGATGSYQGAVTLGADSPVVGTDSRGVRFRNGGGNVVSDLSTTNPSTYSLELWFSSTTNRGGKLIGFGDNRTGLSGNYDRHVYLQDDGRLVFGVWTGSANTITTPAPYNDGAWHHVVATQSPADGMRLYVDGALVGTNPQGAAQAYTGYWKVGGDPTWGSSSPYLVGSVDEVAVYPAVLTAAQVAQHHALGTGTPPPDLTAPSTPGDLAATAGESDAALTWSAATDDVGVVAYEVHRSSDPAFTPSAETHLADVATPGYADAALAPGTYTYRVLARDAAGNVGAASAPVTVTVTGPDTAAPSAPTALTAGVTGTTVQLSWTAATDDRGVTGYDVHRSTDPGFVPSEATRVAQVTATTWTDTGLAIGSYTYRVVARDAAGNTGLPSDPATATVAPSTDPVTVVLAPTEDTWVNQSAPTTPQGTFNQLSARGGTPFQATYLKFDLPPAPAGLRLTGAALRVRTTTAASAGSVDPYTWQWAESGWSQATLVYAGRPALSGVVVGTWPGGSVPSTVYTTPLDPLVFDGRLGATQTLALTSTSTDNVWLWSSEHTTASYRPQLTLTFEAS
ncbi:LamG-like jellyroll fold domain-containing protein [Cellulomonas iranensis]|uniref:LamG-like jellyroll fold domain-containing protein n=1 Tax=Cellulomonas iranensis TaxID=76862 RepID=UPI003D7EFD94